MCDQRTCISFRTTWTHTRPSPTILFIVSRNRHPTPACTTGMPEPSHVLMAMGVEHTLALGALRLTLGRSTTQADVDYVVEILPGIVEKLRTARPVYAPVV